MEDEKSLPVPILSRKFRLSHTKKSLREPFFYISFVNWAFEGLMLAELKGLSGLQEHRATKS